MAEVCCQQLTFFRFVGLGFSAGSNGFFTESGTSWLRKYMFYFALTGMLFKFTANLTFTDVFDITVVDAYLWATGFVYGLVLMAAFLRGTSIEEASFEAQCGVIGNVGFLGVPMLTLLMGEAAIGPVMLVLSIDLIVFGSLIVILVTGSRDGTVGAGILRTVGLGLLKNPMIVSITLGLLWSASGVTIPGVMNDFLDLLGGAATPGALFAIGASLATKRAEHPMVAGWLSLSKLGLHPLFAAFACFVLFPVDPYSAAVMIAAASLPVAGNVFILAQHYGVAPQRVSATILISTVASVVTVSGVVAWVSAL